MSKKLKIALISTTAVLAVALLVISIFGIKQAPKIDGEFVLDLESSLKWMIQNNHPAVATEEKKQSYIEMMQADEMFHDWKEGSLETVRPDDWVVPFPGTWFRRGLSTYRAKYGPVITILNIQDEDAYSMDIKGGEEPYRLYYIRKD